jgi:hypothetical protein
MLERVDRYQEGTAAVHSVTSLSRAGNEDSEGKACHSMLEALLSFLVVC